MVGNSISTELLEVDSGEFLPLDQPDRPQILVLSSSLLTDRMLLYTGFLDVMCRHAEVNVWASSVSSGSNREIWSKSGAAVSEFPSIQPFREFPHNYLRRLNEYTWDFRHRPPSRMSMMRHVRDKRQPPQIRALKFPAFVLARLGLERRLESWLERLLLRYPRSPESAALLRKSRPTAMVCTNPFWYTEPAAVGTAKREGIPVLALIPSWDNISTKNRMPFGFDGYLVWSEQTRRDLHHFYPATRNMPVYVVGAAQFDIFFQKRFSQTREEFCASQGISPDRPYIVYALGSPNFLREHHGAVQMAERVARGDLGDVHMVVRPHPIHDKQELAGLLGKYGPRVVLQRTGFAETHLAARTQDEAQITEWVNTFRHASVVVNLCSTVTVDAAIFDRPVVNLDYDPEPGQRNQALIRDINHLWTHFKPVAESGGVWLVNNPDEMVHAVKTYLRNPELHRERRRWIADYVCGFLDGRCGERMAEAVLDLANEKYRAGEAHRV